MKIEIIYLLVCLGLCVRGLPVNDKDIISRSCIEMTPEREQEIHKIVEEVNGFIETLSNKHEDLDFTLFKLKIENHSDDEDDKETVLKIVINDCKNTGNKTRNTKYLYKNFVADDNLKLAETSSEENTECCDTKSVVENQNSDFEINSESLKERVKNSVNEKRSKINESSKSVNNKQAQSNPRDESEDVSSQNKNDKNESRRIDRSNHEDKTTRPLQDDEIESLMKDLDDLNNNQRNSDNGVFIFAPTIDNSKVVVNNDEVFKNLYNTAIGKLAWLETELEKLKQVKTDRELSNIKDLFNRFDKNTYYSFGAYLHNIYANGLRDNSVYMVTEV